MKNKMIDQNKIVDFVNAVEKKKNFKRVPDKVFRHLVSELAELDSAIYSVEKSVNEKNHQAIHDFFRRRVGDELVDIIFLSCYMADIFGVNLNDRFVPRMEDIARKYDVAWKGLKK